MEGSPAASLARSACVRTSSCGTRASVMYRSTSAQIVSFIWHRPHGSGVIEISDTAPECSLFQRFRLGAAGAPPGSAPGRAKNGDAPSRPSQVHLPRNASFLAVLDHQGDPA